MIQNLFYLLILTASFLTGIILSKLCSDEIKNWRKRFLAIAIFSLLIIVVIIFINFEYKIPAIISLFFIIITNLTIIWKSYN